MTCHLTWLSRVHVQTQVLKVGEWCSPGPLDPISCRTWSPVCRSTQVGRTIRSYLLNSQVGGICIPLLENLVSRASLHLGWGICIPLSGNLVSSASWLVAQVRSVNVQCLTTGMDLAHRAWTGMSKCSSLGVGIHSCRGNGVIDWKAFI